VILYAYLLGSCPVLLRDALYLAISSMFGGKKEALNFLVPFTVDHIQKRDETEDKSPILARFLIQAAPPDDIANPSRLAMRLMFLNFSSIHTSSIFATQALFELAVLHESQREEIRAEVRLALTTEGGWNKAAISGFRKLDSVLKEVGRLHGLGQFGLWRRTIKNGTLPDGTVIPAGYTVMVDIQNIHMNPKIYPNPENFDPFRFSKLSDKEGNDAQYGFTTINKNYLAFGGGRHVCAGRFFVAMELKQMLAQILLNYDFALPAGMTERPKNICFDGSYFPDLRANLVFKRRKEVV